MQSSRETNLDLPKECDYIVSKALAGENTIVVMGCLIFLAFESGDAFALDMDDKYACPLSLDGEKQRFPCSTAGPNGLSGGRGGIQWQGGASSSRTSAARTRRGCPG
jgi:hypothetical protein